MNVYPHLDRRLAPSSTESERYLRIKIQAPDTARPGSRLPLNIALVIDRSGSMSGSKLEKAKEAAIFTLRNLTGADRAAVVAYDDQVRTVSPSRALSPDVKNSMIADIRAIYSGGSTNLSGGWLTGAQEVANHLHEANYLNRAILLSDGLANVGITDPAELERHADQLRQRGVSTTTMGIGADFDEHLMERMAVKGGGHFYFIEDARQIPDILHREIGEVLSTIARQVTLEVTLPEGVHGELLNSFEVTRTGRTFQVRLDDMIAGEERTVVFRLSVRPGALGNSLPITIMLRYTDVESGESRTAASTEAALRYAGQAEADTEAPDSSVVEEVALLRAAQAREEALKLDAAGDYARSATILASAAQYMRAAAPASAEAMQEAEALDAESQNAAQGLGAMARKAMHYSRTTRMQSRKK
ncbi:MAG TPA: VWA domain-containing protein [Chloroflexia bacterium]|nr:VWA domain-containing protein [Chloroflexia bacterium]